MYLYQQENDDDYDPSEDDDDPRYQKAPKVAFDPKLMASDPEAMLKLAKKGKPLMMFATVAGNPTQKETETITSLWQQSLHNGQIQLKRFLFLFLSLLEWLLSFCCIVYICTVLYCRNLLLKHGIVPQTGR